MFRRINARVEHPEDTDTTVHRAIRNDLLWIITEQRGIVSTAHSCALLQKDTCSRACTSGVPTATVSKVHQSADRVSTMPLSGASVSSPQG